MGHNGLRRALQGPSRVLTLQSSLERMLALLQTSFVTRRINDGLQKDDWVSFSTPKALQCFASYQHAVTPIAVSLCLHLHRCTCLLYYYCKCETVLAMIMLLCTVHHCVAINQLKGSALHAC